MRVCLLGPVQSGKSTLFAAVAGAGGSQVDLSRPDQPHLATVKVPDERLLWLSALYQPKKQTFAELEFLDLPGYDLSEAGRSRLRQHWPQMRQSDMLVFVLGVYEEGAEGLSPEALDLLSEPLRLMLDEMLFADLEQVTERLERLETSKKKNAGRREAIERERKLMERLREALEEERPVSEVIQDEEEARLVRGFGFLSQKPLAVVLNASEEVLSQPAPNRLLGLPCLLLSAPIEEELVQLSPEERLEFQRELGLSEPARDRLIRACYERLKLRSFLTVGPDECRAWTIPAQTPAVLAASEIHSDIARGFIRAETVAYDDLFRYGDMKKARAAGKVRLEGKEYLVEDGDIINFRFNV